jgi:uncharacterized protein YodC (DUF2158 family)
MSANFEVGQVVKLKTGGPEMTVVSVAVGKIQAAYNCTWFVGGKQHFGEFLSEAISAVHQDRVIEKSTVRHRRLVSSEDVHGVTVYGPGNESIGRIEHLLIEKVSGRVASAVMSFGGFLGLAHSHYPIPWSALEYDTSLQGYRTGITDAVLREAPTVTDDSLMDRDWETRIHRHYDAPTYWGSTTAHQRSGTS